jgi:hypothetical protein
MASGYLEEATQELQRLKSTADKAVAQVDAGDLFRALDSEGNSIALIMKHIAGNMRSRWTDFLTSDGEKPDRNRDSEFEEESETRTAIMASWEDGWSLLFRTLESLQPADLERTVYIRGEAHSVMQAIGRQMTHYASHVGQIAFLAKHFAGPRWKSLSIPRGKSKEFEVSKDGRPYNVQRQ